jgi:hypothetical protein
MSQLIARILLAIFVVPLASLVYLVTAVKAQRWMEFGPTYDYRDRERLMFIVAGLFGWAFLAAWWFLLWRRSVRWNATRVQLTLACFVVAAIAGALIAMLLDVGDRGFGSFVGSAAAPLLWLVGTIFVWRETSTERAARASSSGRDAVTCPTCGYNLTGLKESRCPECGSQFTLDQILAAQRDRAGADLEV